jgi:signal transduction histidine kinase
MGSIYLLDETSDTLILKAQEGLSGKQLDACSELHRNHKSESAGCDIAFTECIDTPREILHKSNGSYTPYCIPISDGDKVLGLINVFVKNGHREDLQGKAFLNAVSKTIAVIIQRYQIETEKHKLREQLVEAERLAALGRISANVAHEIRNPLTVIGGFARRLLQEAGDEVRKREYVDFIVTEVSRLEEVLKDILNFAKASAPELKEHSVVELVDEVSKVFEPTCVERFINIVKRYDYISEITVDRNRVREVIVNLISNALDAMPDGGTLSIGTAQKIVHGRPFAAVLVSDTGEGIPQDRMDKIFEPFFTTKVLTRGVGLGLSICKKIMEGLLMQRVRWVQAARSLSIFLLTRKKTKTVDAFDDMVQKRTLTCNSWAYFTPTQRFGFSQL